MSQNFLERCNEKMQSIYDCCGKKVNELYAKLAEEVQSLYNHCKAQASELVAKLLEKVQLLYNGCLEKIVAIVAQVKAVIAVAAAVAKIQLTMLERRVRLHVMSIVNKLQAKQQEIVGRMKARYHALLSTWRRNQHFTFWFIPADGQNIAKTHVKKDSFEICFDSSCFIPCFCVLYYRCTGSFCCAKRAAEAGACCL